MTSSTSSPLLPAPAREQRCSTGGGASLELLEGKELRMQHKPANLTSIESLSANLFSCPGLSLRLRVQRGQSKLILALVHYGAELHLPMGLSSALLPCLFNY